MSRLPTFLLGCPRRKRFEVPFIREYKVGCQERKLLFLQRDTKLLFLQWEVKLFLSRDIKLLFSDTSLFSLSLFKIFRIFLLMIFCIKMVVTKEIRFFVAIDKILTGAETIYQISKTLIFDFCP